VRGVSRSLLSGERERGMMSLTNGVPVWLVAIVLAIASPVLVRLYGDHLERATRRRTRRFVERLAPRDAHDAQGDDEVKGAPRE
jgi:hypothetical protein